MATQTRNTDPSNETDAVGDDARDRVDAMAELAGEAIGRAGDQMPAVIDGANRVLAESAQRLADSPDDVLRTGAAAATGFVLGLYLAGAPRLLVTLAVIPVIAIGITLASRPGRRSPAGSPGTR